jgi:hypothetical protein
MLRALVIGLFIAATAVAARAQTPPGEPNSPERFAFCEAARTTCLQGAVQCSSSPEPAVCTEDVETACSKNFETCLAAGTETSTPAPPPAGPAPVSCKQVFSRLHSYLRDPARWIASVWTTNYFANGARYAGRTGIALRRQGRDLFGQSQRTRVFYGGAGAEVENVSFRIRADGKVMLSEIYGPYEPVCSADRFMVLYTGDSIEAFHFKH